MSTTIYPGIENAIDCIVDNPGFDKMGQRLNNWQGVDFLNGEYGPLRARIWADDGMVSVIQFGAYATPIWQADFKAGTPADVIGYALWTAINN